MPRQPQLTPEVQQRIVSAISAGSYLADAAVYGGVTYTTFRRWMLRGEREASGPYRALSEAVTRAEVDAKITALAMWRRAFSTDWRAIQAWLERRYPDEWGRKDRIAIETLKRTEAEQMSRDLGIEVEEVLSAIDGILSGGG